MDCFVASLLAMTSKHTFAFSRQAFARVLQFRCPSEPQRAQGKPGASCARSLVCRVKKANERSHYRFSQFTPAFPAQWFYGFLRALPGERPFLPPWPRWVVQRGLTPGSRRQDHTTSPSTAGVFVRRANTPDATASIASRAQRFVTTAKRPSMGTGRGGLCT